MSDPVTEARFALIEARLAKLEGRPAAANGGGGADVADDRELDGPYGNPVVKKDPSRWSGESFAGCKMSECPADYLESLAGLLDWQADKDDKAGKMWTSQKPGAKPMPASSFARKDAARARGWARRNAGARPAAPTSMVDDPYANRESDAEEIPF